MAASAVAQPVSVLPDELNQALLEFNLMLRYVLSEGLEFDEATRKAIVAVQQMLMGSKIVSTSAPPSAPSVNQPAEPSFPAPPRPPFVAPPEPEFTDALMTAHAALAKIIAPATPLSLAATEPTRHLGYVGNPPLVFWMIVIAAVSAVGFVATSALLATYVRAAVSPTAGATTVASDYPLLYPVNLCFAAALGAVFYVLFTALDYVKDRTYDPRYNSIYVIRFVLGVLSGFILAIILNTSVFNTATSKTIKDIGPVVTALLGGFSTEAVYQILQRMVDMLLTGVRGDNSGAAQAKANDAARNEMLKLADDVPEPTKSKVLAAVKKVGV